MMETNWFRNNPACQKSCEKIRKSGKVRKRNHTEVTNWNSIDMNGAKNKTKRETDVEKERDGNAANYKLSQFQVRNQKI